MSKNTLHHPEEHPIKVTQPETAVSKTIKLGTFLLLAAGSLVVYILIRLNVMTILRDDYQKLLSKLSLAGFVGFLVLALSKFSEGIIAKRAKNRSNRYNLTRLIRLLSFLLFIGIVVSFLFVNWYTAAVSLGLISLILGFALQTPITSFIGWINILARSPYHVGDRIQIEQFTGDVIEIGYFDTTLWEFGGDYLTNDVPSGRIIRFPNSLVLQSAVYNYSWEKFPYIWNEIPFHVAYESDLPFVAKTIREVAARELGPDMSERIHRFKELVKRTAVDELDVKEYPFVALRINTNTWVEVLVTYLVEPRKASATRTKLIQAIVAELLQSPERVMFPKSNAR